jgi:uncharacterized ion transporter superfamily protein YfcC
MIFVGILSRVIPAGSYNRMIVDGREIIDSTSFQYLDNTKLPIWLLFTEPIDVFGCED